jgi:hypothetical protein
MNTVLTGELITTPKGGLERFKKKYEFGSQILINEIRELEVLISKLDNYFLTLKFKKLPIKIKKRLRLDRHVSLKSLERTTWHLKKMEK